MGNLLEIRSINKTFQSHQALEDVSFSIPKDAIFGLLGPNGAGKTTLIRIITKIFNQDSGDILFDGIPIHNMDRLPISYMPEERGLYKKMKVGEQLIYLAQLKGIPLKEARTSIRYWMEKFDIVHWYNKKLDELSKGMHQKVQFISTIVSKPKLLILDEPFSGLDPINANLLKQEILELNQNGTTVIFSTHRMGDVDELCDYIALINHGKIILNGSVSSIKEQFKEHIFQVDVDNVEFAQDKLPEQLVKMEGSSFYYQLEAGQKPGELLKELISQGVEVHAFSEIIPSINEIFITQVEKSNQI